MRFCTLYPNTTNVKLVKDMGMIPYKLYEIFGVDSCIACHKKGDYPYINSEVKGLKIEFIGGDGGNYIKDGCAYLWNKSKDIDVLNIYHMTAYSMAYAFVYKLRNPNGIIYLKLDCSTKLIHRLDNMNFIERKMVRKFLDKADLISAEQRDIIPKLKERIGKNGEKLIHISNGIDNKFLYDNVGNKRKQFIHVARLGAEEKNSESVVEGFKEFAKIDREWKLVLVGPMEKGFNEYLEKVIGDNDELRDRIILKGEIQDRNQLYDLYRNSSIFVLNSDFESFGFVLLEGAFFTNGIISTDVGVIQEIRECTEVEILENSSADEVSRAMERIVYSLKSGKIKERNSDLLFERYNYDDIIKKLKGFIDKNMNSCK